MVRKIISGYGNKALYLIHDKDGNEFAVRWTPYQAPTRNVRVLVTIEATITGHGEYRGVKRTELSPGENMGVDDSHWAVRK